MRLLILARIGSVAAILFAAIPANAGLVSDFQIHHELRLHTDNPSAGVGVRAANGNSLPFSQNDHVSVGSPFIVANATYSFVDTGTTATFAIDILAGLGSDFSNLYGATYYQGDASGLVNTLTFSVAETTYFDFSDRLLQFEIPVLHVKLHDSMVGTAISTAVIYDDESDVGLTYHESGTLGPGTYSVSHWSQAINPHNEQMVPGVHGNFKLILSSNADPIAPEPSTLALAAFGFIGLAALGWRRRRWPIRASMARRIGSGSDGQAA